MIDEQSSASGHDYASDRSAIGAGVSRYVIPLLVRLDGLNVTHLLEFMVFIFGHNNHINID